MIFVGLALAQAPLLEIPRPFWGEYNERLEHCGTGLNDTRLRISWDRLRFYESTGELHQMLRLYDGSVVVIAQHTGQGQTWQSIYRLSLSPDDRSLTVTHPQSGEMEQGEVIRRRCPADAR